MSDFNFFRVGGDAHHIPQVVIAVLFLTSEAVQWWWVLASVVNFCCVTVMLKKTDIQEATTSETKLRSTLTPEETVHPQRKPNRTQRKNRAVPSSPRRPVEPDRLQRQKLQAVGTVASGIAHDFKNLLTIISGNLEMLALDRHDAREQRLLIAEAWRVTDLMGQLTANLLNFVRKGKIDCVATDLGLLATATVRFLKRTLGDGIGLEIEAGDGLRAMINPSQFQAALINLATNARDAMPAGGRVCVQVEKALVDTTFACEIGLVPGPFIKVSVADTGPGMQEDVLDRAFDLFYTTNPCHSGLGLATVRDFATSAGGTARITGNIHCGTTVELWIPLQADTDKNFGHPNN